MSELRGCNLTPWCIRFSTAHVSAPTVIRDDQPIRNFRLWCVISLLVRSYGSVEERSVHTGKVAGSIPARTTGKAPGWKQPGAFCVCLLNADIGICGFGPRKSPGRVSGPGVKADIGV